MARKNRKTLEAKFKKGKMPSENAFADLIDSTLNLVDDGFEKTVEDGLKVSQLGDGKLVSFYQNMAALNAMWFVGLDRATSNLKIGNQFNPNILTLRSLESLSTESDYASNMGVGINKDNPQYTLDVAGTIASHGRVGCAGGMAVPADGQWHDITQKLTGCQAFEIMAGVGGKDGDGKYALMHAFALSTYNDVSDITYHQAHYGAKCNRLKLRWVTESNKDNFEYKLQLGVDTSYGDNIWVKYQITKLWFDTAMHGSEINDSANAAADFKENE